MPRSRELAELATSYDSGGSLGFRNRIINGDCRIDQRNNGASVTVAAAGYLLDRWNFQSTTSSRYSVQRNAGSVTPPTGFTNYAGVTSLGAYSVPAGEQYAVFQPVEGFNVSDFAWGTANAQAVTLSFWVRSSLTGTFGGSFRNAATTRSYPFAYTISAANTWEYKTITVPGDTSGTWVTDNGIGLYLTFGFGVGSTLSGTAGAWAGTNFISATGATSVVGTNGATFYITGVQLEAGSVATPFERRDYGRELIMCQRYCLVLNESGNTTFGSGIAFSATNVFDGTQIAFPTPMRTSPTLSSSGTILALDGMGASLTTTSIGANLNTWGYQLNFGVASGFTTGRLYFARATGGSGSKLTFSSEL
jgi:hypothetical protein